MKTENETTFFSFFIDIYVINHHIFVEKPTLVFFSEFYMKKALK